MQKIGVNPTTNPTMERKRIKNRRETERAKRQKVQGKKEQVKWLKSMMG